MLQHYVIFFGRKLVKEQAVGRQEKVVRILQSFNCNEPRVICRSTAFLVVVYRIFSVGIIVNGDNTISRFWKKLHNTFGKSIHFGDRPVTAPAKGLERFLNSCFGKHPVWIERK